MKAITFLTKVICGLAVLFTSSFLNPTVAVSSEQECQWAPVDQNSFSEILTMIGDQVRENYQKINTWQGRINIVTDDIDEGNVAEKTFSKRLKGDGRPVPNKIKEHQEFAREFALNVNEGLLYESQPQAIRHEIVDVDTGEELQLKEHLYLADKKIILTPNYQLVRSYSENYYNDNRDGAVSRTVTKQAHPQGKVTRGSHLIEVSCGSHLLPVYDPRKSFEVFGNPLWETFANYLAYIDKNGHGSTLAGYTMKVTVEECNVGDTKKYKIVLPGVSSGEPPVYLSNTLVCSSEAGFNVVSFSTTANYKSLIENKAWHYGLINGVYLPLQTTHARFDYQTGNLDTQSTYTFVEQRVNHPINDEVFTYKNLGLQDGDKFIDKILNKEYTYQGGELVETGTTKKQE